MKYAVETASDALMYIPSFIKIYSGIQNLIGGHTDTQTVRKLHNPTFIFQNKKRMLIKINSGNYLKI
jgi:hypothetical protein